MRIAGLLYVFKVIAVFNLQNAVVARVIIGDRRARGVRIQRKGRLGILRYHNIYAKKEVIMSAGAVATPQILMLSGVGPKHHLQGREVIS